MTPSPRPIEIAPWNAGTAVLCVAAALTAGCATTDVGPPPEMISPAAMSEFATSSETAWLGAPSEATAPAPAAVQSAPAPAAPVPAPAAAPALALAPFTDAVPGTAISIEMIPVPAPAGGAAFWIAKTETTWNLYDAFVYRLDQSKPEGGGADAITRPSKPYIAMDRGFGHAGYPAISMSHKGATEFCRWLSLKTGRTYRLPTEAEWRHACSLAGVDAGNADEHAWYKPNARRQTHPVASKKPDTLGIHDLWGNASEWCTGSEGEPVTLGGTFRDPIDGIGCQARVLPVAAWNASDPQFPQSVWWFADAGWVGFRVVCVPEQKN